jgi:hypothetical protein
MLKLSVSKLDTSIYKRLIVLAIYFHFVDGCIKFLKGQAEEIGLPFRTIEVIKYHDYTEELFLNIYSLL